MSGPDLRPADARDQLYRVMNRDEPFEAKATQALELGETYLGVDNAHLAEIDTDNDYWKTVASTDGSEDAYPAGLVGDLGRTYCQHTVERRESLAIPDAATCDILGEREREHNDIRCYHGTTVTVDGEVYGTVCFVAAEPRGRPFADEESMFAELLARMLEHELRIARTRRRAERLDEFADVLSHDLRNPLSVARGHLRLVDDECGSEHVASVATAHDRIDALITDALTVAREGATVTEFSLVGLPAIVRDAWDGVDTADGTLAVRTEAVVRANPTRLRRLLENLFRNSVEHGTTADADGIDGDEADGTGSDSTPEASGDPPVATGGDGLSVTVGATSDGFYVADDGPGIPAEERDRVFEAGFTTDRRGTGLGLNIVREVANAHGWSVSVAESEAGGARFEVHEVDFDQR
jgi:signal transduction histidine kinase